MAESGTVGEFMARIYRTKDGGIVCELITVTF